MEAALLNISVAGIVLDKTEDIGAVNIAYCATFPDAYYKPDAVLKQSICFIRLELGYGVGVVSRPYMRSLPLDRGVKRVVLALSSVLPVT